MKKLIILTVLLSFMVGQMSLVYSQSTSLPELASISISQGPTGIAINPTTNRVYIINSNAHSVSVIDSSTNSLVSEIALQGLPNEIAVNPNTNKIYVTTVAPNSLQVINGSTNVTEVGIGFRNEPSGLAVNPNTNRVYVSTHDDFLITVINGINNSVVTNVSLGLAPGKIAVNPATNKVYIASAGNSVARGIDVINGLNNTVGTTIRFPDSNMTNVLVVNPITYYIYVSIIDSSGSSFISVIDGTTDFKLPSDIQLPQDKIVTDLAINPNTNRIYALLQDKAIPPNAYIAYINGSTNSIEAEFSIGSTRNSNPTIAVNPSTEKLYVGFFTLNVVKVFEGSFTSTSGEEPVEEGDEEDVTLPGLSDLNDVARDLRAIREQLLQETSSGSIRIVINRINRSIGFIKGAVETVENEFDADECDDNLSAAVIHLAKALDFFEARQCKGASTRRCIPKSIVSRYLRRLENLFDALEKKASDDADNDGLPDVCGSSE